MDIVGDSLKNIKDLVLRPGIMEQKTFQGKRAQRVFSEKASGTLRNGK